MASSSSALPPIPHLTFTESFGTNANGGRWQTQTEMERQPLLSPSDLRGRDEEGEDDEDDYPDSDGLYPPNCTWTSDQPTPPRGADPYENARCNVYENIHRIRRDIINTIDDPYSLEQLKAPRMNITVVRPFVNSLYEKKDLSVVYCLLVNRVQFIREQSYAAHHQTVNLTRALLCEMIAEKILRKYNEDNPGPRGLLKLANILVAGFEPFQGAPEEVCKKNLHAMQWVSSQNGRRGKVERSLTALEVAIVSASKSFLASSACQKVVDAIYRGKLVYTPTSFIDIIPDRWKRRPISLYDPRRGPLLNQYRLSVPRTRNLIEVVQFMILLGLYIAVMIGRESRMTTAYHPVEAVFGIYAAGWVLDQFASILEHGWGVYSQNLWSFLDVMFATIYIVYLVLRLHAMGISDEEESTLWARTSLDILSCAAPVLIPRLAFNIMSENVLFVSLRAMISDFVTLSALAVWCFAGFLLSLKWLHNGVHQSITISKWMVWIWFGLDGTGIDEAPDFHWFLGPLLMVLFAFLGNTLFLTILVSMLSNTFSGIVANAVQEIQFRRAVLTFEGVKSDAIFSYMPPFNILALIVLLPLKWTISDRMFHTIHVAAVRVLNLPTLLLIAWYERRTLWITDKRRKYGGRRIDWKNANGPGITHAQYWAISRFSVHGDLHAVFEVDPPQSVLDRISEEDNFEPGDPLGDLTRDRLNAHFGHSSRHNSVAVDVPRKSSTEAPAKKKEEDEQKDEALKKKEEQKDEALKKEFADSSEEEDADHPTGYRKPKRGKRMDSMLDLGDTDRDARLLEATTRLHKMEEAMERMETMIVQLLGDDARSESSQQARTSEQADVASQTS